MPHIVVEYSGNLDQIEIPALLSALHAELASNDSVDIKRIKTRATRAPDHVVGALGASGAFVHVTLKLLPRPPEVARAMAQALQNIVRRHVPQDCAVTVEVVTLNPETYCA